MKKNIYILFSLISLLVFSGVKHAKAQPQCTITINLIDTIKCYGQNATIEVITQGGNGWYNYECQYQIFASWISFANQNTFDTAYFTNLPANNYRIIVTDTAAGGCIDTGFILITQPLNMTASFVVSSPSLCFGDSVADLTLTVNGGVPPYSVTLNGGASIPMTGGTHIFSNLPAGTYQAIVTDANGCTRTRNRTITSPPQIVPNSSISSNYNGYDISCFGGNDGAILANVSSGGTSPFQYAINGGLFGSNPLFPNLTAGINIVNYLDANGCTTSDTLSLQDPPDLSGSISLTSGISCNGACDGQITFNVDPSNPGVPTYQYAINGGAFQPNATYINACGDSTYQITVQDINGCQYTDNFLVTQPDSLTFIAVVNSNYNGYGVSCFGATDGVIQVTSVAGGTPQYTYSINGGVFGSSLFFTNLSAGVHTVTVQDANGCTKSATLTITQPNAYSITLSTNVSYNGFGVACNGDCNGSIHVTSTGGVPTYLYSLNGGPAQASSNFNNQCANIILTVIATDANGCTAQANITLTEPTPLTLQMDSVMENCGAGDGQAIAIVGGGVPAYTYQWTGGQTTSTATNLSIGTYTVIATDANGCSITDNVTVPGTNIILTTTATPASCNGINDGTATVSVVGNYATPLSFQWNDPSFQTTATATGLSAGTYAVQVTDGNGCSAYDTTDVLQPTSIILTIDAINSDLVVPCFGDSLGIVSLSATGGTGYGTYWFYIDAANPQNDSNFYGLPAGSYWMFVNDANGCMDSVNAIISQPAAINFSLSKTDVLCNGGATGTAKVTTVLGGTTPYTYNWNNGATTDSIGGLSVGNYWVVVSDANGCTALADTITISEPTLLTTTVTTTSSLCGGTVANGTAQVIASGGTSPYTYLWSNGANTQNISLLDSGNYVITVTDGNNCTSIDTAVVLPSSNPILSYVIQNVSCFGANDGTITPSATGGMSPYQFSINGGFSWQNNGVVYGPSGPNGYFVTVRDANGCVESDSVYVTEPALLQINSFTIDQVNCFGGNDGSITVNHSGGTPGYFYNWSNGASAQIATSLTVGNYSVTVTDTNGCSISSSTTMTEPDSLYITSMLTTDVLCNGGNDGTATVNVMGGVLPYSYAWSNGAITQTAFSSAGNIVVNVTDANGCIVNGNIQVNEPAAIVVNSFIRDSVSCFGGSNGQATAFVSGGILPYTYLWDNGNNTTTATGLNAGFHTIAITDANNCVHIDSVEILQPAAYVSIDSLIVNQISCKDASNGSIVILATGGTPPYMYSKNGGLNYQTAIGFIGLSPSTYNIMVRDNNGCTTSVLQNITEPDSLLIDSLDFHHVSCYGYNNGYISDIHVSGGTQPYLYSVNGSVPQQYPVFNSAINPGVIGGPGTYTVEVRDDHNCIISEIIIINEPQQLNTTIITSDYNGYEVRCYGGNTGWITVNTTGGVAPYTKTWTDVLGNVIQSSTSSTVSNLIAGLYTLTIEDANACMKQQFITMTQPTAIQHNFVLSHVTCDGWSNGSITDSVFGGVPGYSYLWNTGNIADTTFSLNNLPVGNYTITATDENNCSTSETAIINDNDKLVANIAGIQNVSCWGYCDGYIEVTTSGGMPYYDSFGNEIYNNLWNDPLSQIDSTAIGLCANPNTLSTIYTNTITDAIGCITTISATITQPAKLEVSTTIDFTVSCFAGNDGMVHATSVGGIAPYTYLWNTGGTGAVLNNISTGSYVVIATDANGCLDTTEVYLGEPTQLSVSLSFTNVSCKDDGNGSITANPSGGTPNTPSGTYNYTWSNGQNTQTATNLSPGLYSVIVTDAEGCTITSNNQLITEPASELFVTIDSTDETCAMNDGTAIAYPAGGTPNYVYSWSNGGTSALVNGLLPGIYTVNVTDVNGCVATASTYINAFDAIFLPNFADQFTDTICLGDNITISVVDNPNFTYNWSSGHITPTITVRPDAPRTDYILTVTDVNCPNNPFDVVASVWTSQLPINPVATPNPIKLGDAVEIIATSDTNYPFYQWVDETGTIISNAKSTTVYPESSTTYYIMVTDTAGCHGFDSVRVIVGVLVYDGITPNGDGYNDFWEIEDIDQYPNAIIEVYNRWGSLLFSEKGANYNNNKWDGTYNGEQLPVGTYYFIINLNDDSEPQTGPITIIR